MKDPSFQIEFYKRKAACPQAASKPINPESNDVTRFHIQSHYAQQGELLSG